MLLVAALPVRAAFEGLDHISFERYAGATKYDTAGVVAAQFPADVPAVYVATGEGFPDALSAGPAAIHRGGPVLLVTKTTIPMPTQVQLSRLSPEVIYIAGGTSVVSAAVAADLAEYADTGAVIRLAGQTRYDTSAAVSAGTFAPGVDTAYIATGSNFPDALAGVPATAQRPGPILLVKKSEIPTRIATELARLKPQRIVILGGTSVVSPAVEGALANYTEGAVERVAGADRYATGVAISSANWAAADVVYIATGRNYPDALAGGPLAAMNDAPLLLISGGTIPAVVRAELQRLHPESVRILGGTTVMPGSVTAEIYSLLGFAQFEDGTHAVGSGIPPGTYRSAGDDWCGWWRLSATDGDRDANTIAHGFGKLNIVVTIAPGDAGFHATECGTWSNSLTPITASPTAPFGEGTFIVDFDIAPGTWQAPGGGSCYWQRMSGFSGQPALDVIANGWDTINPQVTIAASDAGFSSEACGTWTRIGD